MTDKSDKSSKDIETEENDSDTQFSEGEDMVEEDNWKLIQDEINKNETEIDINGITYDLLKNQPFSQKLKFTQCGYCQKFYKKEKKMVTIEHDEEKIPTCFHCIFWMFYGSELRSTVDGMYGKTICEYVLECKDYHDVDICERKDACFLCDFLNGIKIEGILCGETLHEKMDIKETPASEEFILNVCI